jgi:hypothetical protein
MKAFHLVGAFIWAQTAIDAALVSISRQPGGLIFMSVAADLVITITTPGNEAAAI